MAGKLKVFLFADALGFELVQRYKFMDKEFPVRIPVRTQFGYSSTAVPTILSGQPPTAHGHFSFFFRSAGTPFGIFKFLHFLLHPGIIFNNHRIRHRFSKIFAKWKHYTGYFNLYRVPYSRLPYFDYCEKQDIFAPDGLAPVPNLYDMLTKTGVKFHISDWRKGDDENLAEALRLIKEGEHEFMFIYTAGLDGMLHFHVHEPETVAKKFEDFAERVRELLREAEKNYDDIAFYIISDHGMTPLTGEVDLKSRLESDPFRFGRDFIVCYDSTMLRLWILNNSIKGDLMRRMDDMPGHWLSDVEKRALHIDFADQCYGEEIFLLDPGIQLVPSDMGGRAIPGMHGYTPDDKDSTACILSTHELPMTPREIAEFFDLMKLEAENLAGGKE